MGRVVSIGFEDVSLSWRTRVEEATGATLTLVAPTRALGDAIVPDPGRPVLLGWAESDGYFQADCTFRATGVDTVVTWILTVDRVQRLQRRTAFRIDASGPVSLLSDRQVLSARLRNVSEGGLCVVLPARSAPADGARLEVTAELEELGEFSCEATVVRVGPPSELAEVEVGVAFEDLDEVRVEELRQFVFAEQLRRRRATSGR